MCGRVSGGVSSYCNVLLLAPVPPPTRLHAFRHVPMPRLFALDTSCIVDGALPHTSPVYTKKALMPMPGACSTAPRSTVQEACGRSDREEGQPRSVHRAALRAHACRADAAEVQLPMRSEYQGGLPTKDASHIHACMEGRRGGRGGGWAEAAGTHNAQRQVAQHAHQDARDEGRGGGGRNCTAGRRRTGLTHIRVGGCMVDVSKGPGPIISPERG